MADDIKEPVHGQKKTGEIDRDSMERPSAGTQCEVTQADNKQRVFYNPVDRGWSWVILVCSFLSNVLVMGVLRTFGVLFVPIQNKFHAEASAVSLIPGLQGVILSIVGLMTMMIVLRVMSVRNVIRLGTVMGAVGLSLCYLARSVTFLYLSQALLCGVGLASSYGPGFVLLGSYFDKRRAMAVAIANTGGSVGTLLLPLITSKLLQEYSLAGTYLLLGGIMAQNLVVASFFTPPSDYKPPSHTNSSLDADPTVTTALVDSKDSDNENNQAGCGEVSHFTQLRGTSNEKENDTKPETFRARTFSESQKTHLVTFPELEAGDAMCLKPTRPIYRRKFSEGSRPDFQTQKSITSQGSCEYRHSLLYLSCETIYCPPADLTSTRSVPTDELRALEEMEELDCREPDNKVKQCLASCFDPSLVKSPLLWLLLAHIFFGVYGMIMPTGFLPPLAMEKGLDVSQAAFLLTVVGCLDIVSRLVPGFVAQMKWLKPQTMVCMANLVLGTAFQLTSFYNSWGAMMGLAVVVGLCAGVFVAMTQLITIDFVGVDKFPQAFGFVQTAMGMAISSGHPLLGYLRDVTGSYVIPFHVIGASVYVSALLLLLEPLVRRLQRKPTS